MRNAIKVLIIDDDKASAQMLSEVVKRMGFKPVIALKPIDALNVVRLQTVHAAIVDVLLPKMTGVELVTEFRKTRFADNPVVFVSGVFKDKAFAAETIRKTGAVDFLFKPFDTESLIKVISNAMKDLLSAERWSVQSLLTRKLHSDRERAKAIENLETIKGLDFPFVLSILMEVGSSGHLNIVNDMGEIFGVTLIKGTISEVDSTESQSAGVLALISKGYLSQEDWDEFQKNGTRKFSLERLVTEGYVSPHAVSEARREQILNDFRSICSALSLQVNFVPQEDNEVPPKHAVMRHDLMDLLKPSLDEFFPADYLQQFYESVKGSPIRIVGEAHQVQSIWKAKAFLNMDMLKTAVEQGGTLEQALLSNPQTHQNIYQCLHYLVLNRAIMFDDLNRAKNLNSMLDRYKKLYDELNGKTADKIFEYFGVNPTANADAINGIYDVFARSNHPDQLGKEATPELRELCAKCLNIVKEAKSVLLDDSQKTALFSQIKAQAVEKHQQSQQMMNEGLELLRKGKASEALEKLKIAEARGPNSRLSFISAWAEIKAGAHSNRPRLHELQRKIDTTTVEEKKSSFYYMASGLIKKYMGDVTAVQMFEKAVLIDSDFAEARRELHAMQNASGAKVAEAKKLDLFTGDITQVVSKIFRRKAD